MAMRSGVCAAAILLAGIAGAQCETFNGVWTLDPRLSKYAAGPAPAAMSVSIEGVEQGLHYRSTLTTGSGAAQLTEYTASFDGPPALVSGTYGFRAPVALRCVDAHTVHASYVRSLQEIASSTWILSAGAKRLTITTQSKDEQGVPRVNVSVFHKEKR